MGITRVTDGGRVKDPTIHNINSEIFPVGIRTIEDGTRIVATGNGVALATEETSPPQTPANRGGVSKRSVSQMSWNPEHGL